MIEDAHDGRERINRINYEIAVLQALRDRLRCKEIWVVGADRYRNPDEDLPADFDDAREPTTKPSGNPGTPTPSSRCAPRWRRLPRPPGRGTAPNRRVASVIERGTDLAPPPGTPARAAQPRALKAEIAGAGR